MQTMEFDRDRIRSHVPGIEWPALPDGNAGALMALLWQYERTQWLSREEIEALQFRQLGALLSHAYRTVPFYRERLAHAGYAHGRALTRETWNSIPVLERAELQEAGEKLHSTALPKSHGAARTIRSSGSTGRPVEALTTGITRLVWSALKLRDHAWHRRDLKGRHGAIRVLERDAGGEKPAVAQRGWGRTEEALFETGPSYGLSLTATIAGQAAWLARVDPHYLVAFPSALQDLILHCRDKGVRPKSLREVRTLSEPVEPELRALCRAEWGVPIADMYSARETGYLALQCPEHEVLHVQAESVLVEAIAPDGRACGPGEMGRAVVTPLANFAMPLVRYDVGDFIELGPPCDCGRGLPVIRRVLGRVRNMVTLPNGERFWPQFSALRYGEVLPVRQHQIVQKALDRLEVRLVADRRGTPEEEQKLREMIVQRIGYPFQIGFTYTDRIPRGRGGKFEEFRSELP